MIKRSARDYALLYLKGMAMGAADIVPGVSGGTVAFISGIYSELLHSLRSIDFKTLALLRTGIKAPWLAVNANFLLVLLLGILTSIVLFSHGIKSALEHHPILVWGFFLGLILASSIYMARQLTCWHWQELLSLALGLSLALVISLLPALQLPSSPLVFFAAGSVAICAMILPGVSGSFILLLLGLYAPVLQAISNVNISLLGSFLAGALVGLLLFSRLLSSLLDRYESATLALLTGFLLGSLNMVWPWKQALEVTLKPSGELVPLVQENLLPHTYSVVTGLPSQWFFVLLLAIFGAVLVFALEILGGRVIQQDDARSVLD